jgi:hypothetical protein
MTRFTHRSDCSKFSAEKAAGLARYWRTCSRPQSPRKSDLIIRMRASSMVPALGGWLFSSQLRDRRHRRGEGKFRKGWELVRASNTQPALEARFESRDEGAGWQRSAPLPNVSSKSSAPHFEPPALLDVAIFYNSVERL